MAHDLVEEDLHGRQEVVLVHLVDYEADVGEDLGFFVEFVEYGVWGFGGADQVHLFIVLGLEFNLVFCFFDYFL